MSQSILLFADKLPPLPGGMEVHAEYFINYFTNHQEFPLIGIITKNEKGEDFLITHSYQKVINIKEFALILNPHLIFFNSGRWIEELREIHKIFPNATFIYRTGGNEIIKASLSLNKISDHHDRQNYWSSTINDTINLLITNSVYTETRLRTIGLICPFFKIIGGVNTKALKRNKPSINEPIIIFCGARFVPYKNHAVLINIIHTLFLRGHKFCLRLAGSGPLLKKTQMLVNSLGLNSVVKFLNVLNNYETCNEVAQANLYIQLSSDYLTHVEGGTYVHSEGMGRCILEALTAGTYVIAGKSGALPEIISKERGVFVNLDELDETTNKIEELLLNLPNRLPFIDTFSWDNVFKQYEILFRTFK